jgi:hypothetical protein
MELRARLVKGNHEEKALRFLRHEARAAAEPGYRNPMRPVPAERLAEWRSLSEDQVAWLRDAPTTLELPCNWVAVHAGFEPGLETDRQKDQHLVRVRFVDSSGKMVGYSEGSLDQPEGTVYWTEQWRGPRNVVYGHAVHSKEAPRIDYVDDLGCSTVYGTSQVAAHVACVGIDTGCCFGGRLTAMVLEGSSYSFAQVPAAREYYPWPGGSMGVTSGD